MSILVGNETKLVVSGLTGREGSFHGLNNRRYGTDVVAGVTPGKGGQDVEGIPVFDTFRAAVAATGADTTCFAEDLPFADRSFDTAVTRIAAHHFADVGRAVSELARVASRVVLVEDTLYTDERVEAAEKLRDPTHVRSYTEREWRGFFAAAGLEVEEVEERTITADVQEWYEFLSAYHEAVLGWVGGSLKVDGREPPEEAVADRLALMRQALDVIFGGRPTFRCCWTYVTARA